MKATYKGFEAKKSGGFTELPPVGAYVAEIKQAQFVAKEQDWQRDAIECFIEIIEGEYAGRFTEVWQDQKEQFGDKVQYRGIFRLIPPVDGDEDWRKRAFEGNLWCVQESNPGYAWDWDEKKLKGKKVGINIRKRLYTTKDKDGNPVDRETIEIGKFETIEDVRAGKCRPMKDNNKRKKHDDEASDNAGYTDVSNDRSVDMPWNN